MPTGGATGDATGLLTGSGSAPGTSAGGVCWTGGADEAATIQSLTERVTQLEEKMAQLFGADWETSQLSNGSAQIGWITGVEYMGVPGWTQTEYGTLIPPPGVTLASLGLVPPTIPNTTGIPSQNMLGITFVDENGNIVFGFNQLDGLFGDQIEVWNAAGEMDYATTQYSSTAGTYNSSRGITITDAAPTGEGDAKLTVSQSGLYLVTGYAQWFVGTPTAYSATLNLFTPYPAQDTYDQDTTPDILFRPISLTVSKPVILSAGNLIELELDVDPAGAGGFLIKFEFSAIRLSS